MIVGPRSFAADRIWCFCQVLQTPVHNLEKNKMNIYGYKLFIIIIIATILRP